MANTPTNTPPNRSILFSRQFLGKLLFFGLLLLTLHGTFQIMSPYLHPIILAIVFATLFFPAHEFILRKVKGRVNLAAGLSCALIALLVLVPLLSFSAVLVGKAHDTYGKVYEWLENDRLERELEPFGLPEIARAIRRVLPKKSTILPQAVPEEPIEEAQSLDEPGQGIEPVPSIRASADAAPAAELNTEKQWKRDVGRYIRKFTAWCSNNPRMKGVNLTSALDLAGNLAGHTKKVLGILVNFVLMLFVMFYLFRDGKKILAYMLLLSPLKPEHEQLLIKRIHSVTRSAIMGTLLTAVVQGVLGMIAFAVVGIPAFFWGVVMGFASLIPMVGTALVWIPCCLYLLIIGNVVAAVGLAIWSIIVVGMSDNFLRPILMHGDTGMSSVIAFFAILGGIQFFGLIGVIYGPLIFGLCAMLLYIYQLELGPAPVAEKSHKRRRKRRRPRPRPEVNSD